MTAPVRRTDARGDSRGGAAPDLGAEGRPPLGERLALRNWSLPVKLAAVLLVPTLFVITLGVLRIVEQTDKASSYDGVQQAVALENRNASLLSALDVERRAAAVFLATNRAGGFGPVQEAVDRTVDQTNQLRSAYESADSVDAQTRTAYRGAFNAVEGLDRVRDDVRGGAVDPAGAISRYTDATATVLTFDESLTREAADPSIAGLSTGLYALSVVREQDAYVQAVVAAAIAGGRIDAPSIDQARNATLRRTIAVDEFRSAVGTDNAALADGVVGPDVDQRDRLAQVVLGRGSAGLPLQVSAQDWDAASEAVQQRVGDVSDQLRTRLQTNAGELQNGARNAAGIASVVLLLALMAGAAVVFFVTRSLLRPLRLLRRTALDVAERRLPDAVRSLREGQEPETQVTRTPIETREEIGQVARAFDQVHEQAVRLAAEQAGLRSAFNSIFVNLSRRSQTLVERQLRLIEQLENKEEDPEALHDLFQLDHLATRMRRNSENLLVLSGTDLARRGGRPVPLVDVLRAGASEVEQYQRVELSPPPSVQLLGRTAGDVVHLVAELLENATTFSAPETRVDVLARSEHDGSVILEIADRGVGMTDEDLADSNQRLASPPTVDVSASRRMGLFVVGRLAIRHSIGVSLRTRDEGGVVASVRIPAAAVLSGAQGRPGGGPSTRALGGTGLPVRSPGSTPLGSGAPANGAGRPDAPGIPRQTTREGTSDLPRRSAVRGGAAAGAGIAAAGAASYFTPSTAPAEAAPAATEDGTSDEAPQRNGVGGALAAALPRRPVRPGAGPDPTSGPPADDDVVSGPQAAPVDDDDDDEDDDRVASLVPGDDEGVTVWSQGPATGGVPVRPHAAHAWHGADGETGDQADDTVLEEPDAVSAGRHGLVPNGVGPAGTTRDGRPAPRPRPAAPQGFTEGAPSPAGPGGPPAGHPVLPARPGASGPGRPQPGPGRPGPGQSGPGQSGAGQFGPGQPGPGQPGPGQPGPAPAGPRPAPWGPPRDTGPRAAGSPPAPQPTMWNGAEVVPPPGPTPDEHPAEAEQPRESEAPTSVSPAVEPEAVQAAPDVVAPEQDEVEAAAPVESESDASAEEESLPSRANRLTLRPLSQRRRPEGGPLLRPGSAPRLRPRPAAEGDAEAPAAQGDALFAPPDAPMTPEPAPEQPEPGVVGTAPAAPAPVPTATGNGAHTNGNGTHGHENGNGAHANGNGNGTNGNGLPSGRLPRPSAETLPRRPAAVLPNRERTPIFDEVASVWFREPEPDDPSVDPEWDDTGRAGFEAGTPSLATVDAGTTEAGLPRRRPRAHLVPGSARPAPTRAPSPGGPAEAGPPKRSPDAVRGRLASYQRGVADGRSTRLARRPDGAATTGETTHDPEEEQQ